MDRALRFCMITTFYPPYNFGGDGVFVYRLSNELAQRGHHVEIIHCTDAYSALQGTAGSEKYNNHSNIIVHALKSKAGILSPLWTHQFGSPGFKGGKIKRVLERGNFDVLHFHNISLIGGPGILKYGRAIKLYTMHEYWLVCPTHILFKFNQYPCTKRSCFRCCLSYKRPPQLWRYTGMIQKLARHVDAFIAPSKFVAYMHRQMGLDVHTEYIPMFVPELPNVWHRSELIELPDRPYFLFVGRLEKLKGIQNIIPIFTKYGHADLYIVGSGSYEANLRRLADGSPRVKFLGPMSSDNLTAYYANAIALIVPSICYETYGHVVVEAYSMKTPVIVRDIGAIRELVSDAGGGYIYRREEELVSILDELRLDPELRNNLGQKGYEAYLRKWTADIHVDSYLELIGKISRRKHTCFNGKSVSVDSEISVGAQGGNRFRARSPK